MESGRTQTKEVDIYWEEIEVEGENSTESGPIVSFDLGTLFHVPAFYAVKTTVSWVSTVGNAEGYFICLVPVSWES